MTRRRAVVVGSGASGGMVARVLARSGDWDVVVLEKGRNFFTNLGGPTDRVSNLWANDELGYESRIAPLSQDPLLEPRTFRTAPSAGARSYVGNVQCLPTTVGGGTVHYDAKARRMHEVDFITNTLMGGTADRPAIPGTTYTDWPMNYRQFEPFFAVCEEVVGVQGPAHRCDGRVVNPNPYESWRSTPFAMPPGVAMLSGRLVGEAAKRVGYTVAPVPTAITSRPYRGRPACVDCAQCLNYGCPINAKSSGVWPLQDALRTGRTELRTQANVVSVEYRKAANGRYQATGVVYQDASGTTHRVCADLVVLANNPIEATRLSMLSGIAQVPNENQLSSAQPSPTEPSGLLGRNLMFHLQTVAIAVLSDDIHPWRGRTSTHTLDAFIGSGPSPATFDPAIPRAGITEIGGNYNPISEANAPDPLLYGASHKEWMRLGAVTKRLIGLTLQGEDMPQITNYVDLDPQIVDVYGQPVPRITYHSHEYELAASAYYGPRMIEVLQAIGGPGSQYPGLRPIFTGVINTTIPPVVPGPVDPSGSEILQQTPFSEIPASAHIMGTHRMALDPEHGPCDPFGRYWAFDNLYHAGGGLFCTAPGVNVTLTMWALSYWAAASVVAGVDRRSSYTPAQVAAGQQRLLEVIRKLDADTMIARTLS